MSGFVNPREINGEVMYCRCFSRLLVNATAICHRNLKKDCQQLLFMHAM